MHTNALASAGIMCKKKEKRAAAFKGPIIRCSILQGEPI